MNFPLPSIISSFSSFEFQKNWAILVKTKHIILGTSDVDWNFSQRRLELTFIKEGQFQSLRLHQYHPFSLRNQVRAGAFKTRGNYHKKFFRWCHLRWWSLEHHQRREQCKWRRCDHHHLETSHHRWTKQIGNTFPSLLPPFFWTLCSPNVHHLMRH